jgi:phage gp29-like protein
MAGIRDILNVRNWGFNTTNTGDSTNLGKDHSKTAQNLSNYITPVQLQRLRTDVSMWRDAVGEAERAYYPFRVKMQRVFIDTILNGHVFALMERRKDLTLLRKFEISDAKGKKNEELTEFFSNAPWFGDFVNYSLDALFFGYSLISLGDIEGGKLKDVSIVPRWYVSPDREQVGSFIYATSGANFTEEPYNDWHIYVKTKSDNGVSPCGYGLMYQIALYEIFLRNTLGFNGDFVELFAMPYRVGKTTKTEEKERGELENAIKNMGSAGYAIVDPMDEIEFLESKTSGSAYKSYESLEQRCEQKVSKIILGHADAVDSTAGKLGAGQGEDSPVAQALEDKQTKDGRFIENIINNELIPRLKKLGVVNIPDGVTFKFLNDGEAQEQRQSEDASNLITAQIAQTMKNAGLQMDAEYFAERTGIKAEAVEVAPAVADKGNKEDLRNNLQVKNRLIDLYKEA